MSYFFLSWVFFFILNLKVKHFQILSRQEKQKTYNQMIKKFTNAKVAKLAPENLIQIRPKYKFFLKINRTHFNQMEQNVFTLATLSIFSLPRNNPYLRPVASNYVFGLSLTTFSVNVSIDLSITKFYCISILLN